MNFFKSILSDDLDPDPDPDPEIPEKDVPEVYPDGNSTTEADDGGVWSFGGLIKTISTRSESVLETYRRDLQEFGSGLKKETELFREVATRAVKDLPNSIDAVKDTLLASSDIEPETPDSTRVVNLGRFSRFESQLMNIQSDPNTFCVDPEDLGEYKKWKNGFDLNEKSKEVEILIEKIGSLESIYKRVVPNEVDYDNFWCRYYYKVYKLKEQESVRAKLVNRARFIDDEEELSWDVDDDDDNEQVSNTELKVDEKGKEGSVVDVKKLGFDENESVNQDSTNVVKELAIKKGELSKEDSTNVVKEGASNKSELSKEDLTNVAKEGATNKGEPSKEDLTDVAKEVATSKSELRKQDSSNVAKEVPTNKSEPSKEDLTNVAKEVATNKSEPSKEDSSNVAKEVVTNKGEPSKEDLTNVAKQATHSDESQTLSSGGVDRKDENQSNVDGGGKSQAVESSGNSKDSKKEDTEVSKKEEGVVKGSEGKGDKDESGIASSQKTGADEDDLDWAEIEDIYGNDDKKATTSHVAISNRADLRKRLSVEEDDEDLSWDIEDDD
ncbi:hypothetical protein K7X08_011073 [Anisodus acutangulus]|uniref:BSD domain-containing protein n=1 Tax=Anisodus acutangulus TaxID=402998 RepID=A0A9Q1RA48_9SOLA|nr:hypothetical protein K7X08_011073 [Anisodus acutangulus]